MSKATWRFLRLVAARGVVLAACLFARPVFAAETTAEEKLFDQPVATQDLDAVGGAHAQEAVRCHWFADLMIRETQTDSPGFGPAYVVYPGPGGARPVCRAKPTARDTKLDMQSEALLGRKGAYLVFELTDSFGAEPFFVLHLPDGRQVYTDQTASGVEAVAVEGDALRLRYQRGYDAPCSLLTQGVACWRQAMQAGHFARAIASQPPPDCAAAYKAVPELPASNPSTIVYDVEVRVAPAGRATVVSRGRVGCLSSGG